MLNHYILKDWKIVSATLEEWGQFMETGNRVVNKTIIDNVRVSTVFIGIDDDELFETMIFGGKHDQYQERHNTLIEAKNGHSRACKLVRCNNV